MPKSTKKKNKAPLETAIDSVLVLDGFNDWVEFPPGSMPWGNAITCSFWAYGSDALPRDTSVICASDANGNRILNIHLPWSNGFIYFDCGNNASTFDRIEKQASPEAYKDNWFHWAFTKDATTGEMKIYFNGQLWHSGTGKTLALPKSSFVRLGCYGEGSHFYPGKLAELQLWNRARTEAEIKQNMSRRLIGDEPGLVGYWPLNDGEGAIAEDRTENGNHGTIHGNPSWGLSTLSLVDALPSESEKEKAPSSPAMPTQTSDTPMITEIGPAGSAIAATAFAIQPRTGVAASKIHSVSLSSGWAVDKIQVRYENPATNPAETYDSQAFGGGGGSLSAFRLAQGDYLTSVSGTWGAQAPGYPREEIVSLQFHTHQGNQSQVFGGGNAQKQVEPFTLVAPEGSEIIGFFGAYGSHQNGLVRLGIYTRPFQSAKVAIADNNTAVLQFDGQTNYIEIPHQSVLGLTNNFTVEAWFNAQTLEGYRRMFSKFPGFGYGLVGSSLLFTTYWIQDYATAAQLTAGTWYHLAIVFDASNSVYFYLNGELLKTVAGESPATLAAGVLEIGRKAEGHGEYWHGQLAELRLWNRAKTAAEIQAGKSCRLVGDEPNLVGYWPLNEGVGTTIQDKTSNANHGSIRGNNVFWGLSTLELAAAELKGAPGTSSQAIEEQAQPSAPEGKEQIPSIPEAKVPSQGETVAKLETPLAPIIIEMEPLSDEAVLEFFTKGNGPIYDSVDSALDQMKAQGAFARNAVPVFIVISGSVATTA